MNNEFKKLWVKIILNIKFGHKKFLFTCFSFKVNLIRNKQVMSKYLILANNLSLNWSNHIVKQDGGIIQLIVQKLHFPKTIYVQVSPFLSWIIWTVLNNCWCNYKVSDAYTEPFNTNNNGLSMGSSYVFSPHVLSGRSSLLLSHLACSLGI